MHQHAPTIASVINLRSTKVSSGSSCSKISCRVSTSAPATSTIVHHVQPDVIHVIRCPENVYYQVCIRYVYVTHVLHMFLMRSLSNPLLKTYKNWMGLMILMSLIDKGQCDPASLGDKKSVAHGRHGHFTRGSGHRSLLSSHAPRV